MTTHVIRTEVDFRQVVVSYAQEAAAHGAVYIEGIFTPAERVARRRVVGRGVHRLLRRRDRGRARRTGVEVRLTPDIPRGFPLEAALETARYSVKYRDRGVVGLGLGGREAGFPPEPFAPAFRIAKDGGLGSVPHAGETEGVGVDPGRARRARRRPAAPRHPRRRRSRAARRDRGTRHRLRRVPDLESPHAGRRRRSTTHPLPAMLAAGVLCSISTDDPAMFDTDLTRDYEAAAAPRADRPRRAFDAGVAGALCDDATKVALGAWPRTVAGRP